MTRGILRETEDWKYQLDANYLTYGKTAVQLAVRPIQLWELVFPKEHLPAVLKTLGWKGEEACRKDISFQTMMLRKALKLKKIPKVDLTKAPTLYAPSTTFAAPIIIGMREDKGRWPKGTKTTLPNGQEVDMSGLEQL